MGVPPKASRAEKVYQRKCLQAVREYKIVVPYYARDSRGRPTNTVAEHVFPPQGTSPYNFKQAIDLLEMFNQKWIRNSESPPPSLEPRAIEIGWVGKRADPRQFTYRDILALDLLALPVAAEDDEDDAARWLREHAEPEEETRFIDL